MKKMSVSQLKELLDSYDYAYHTLDDPIIDDESYDALKKRYLELAFNVEEQVHGGGISNKFDKVPHLHPILSLEKVHDGGTLLSKMQEYKDGVVQPKLDGLTIVVYGKGTLKDDRAVWATRGSGSEGEDVSHTCQMIQDFKAIDNIIYRAEVFMPKAEFEKLNKEKIANGEEPFKNPRNAAAGMIRNLDPSKVRGLSYFAYNIIGSSLTETKQLELLKMYGIKTVHSKYFEDRDESRERAKDFIVNFSKQSRDSLPYEIDGMVIKTNQPDAINKFGSTGHHFKNAIAFKYASESHTTILRDVVWQLGKHGTLSPVAIFDPVDIMGSTVSRATLHNINYILGLDLKLAYEIEVIKANDVIPRVVSGKPGELFNSLSDQIQEAMNIKLPDECPVCGSHTRFDGAILECANMNCQGKIVAQVTHLATKDCLNIEGLSNKTIQKMFDAGYLNSKFDIFNVTSEDIQKLDGFAKPSADKLYNNIQNSRRNVPFDRVIYAAGINGVGRTASKDISRELSKHHNDPYMALLADMLEGCPQLMNIRNIGKETVQAMYTNLDSIKAAYRAMDSVIYPDKNTSPVNKPSLSLSFVITGALSMSRDKMKELIESKGHRVSSSVSKSTSYLVTNETKTTSKLTKASNLGIPIINEDDLMDILNSVA